MLAIVDCNNYYASCERSFNPALENQPIVVLSNNDGCVIARSNEAKALGVKMGTPYFQLTDLIPQESIRVFSSNYALYGDMSARIMAILARFVEQIEVYSIDEAFLDLSGYEAAYPDLTILAHTIRSTVRQWTRIPVSIGIAPTKTLTKVANWYAKRQPECGGVFMLDTPDQISVALAGFSVDDLWGIGHRYARLLKRNGIRTAAQFRDLPDDWINTNLTVNGLRLAYELRGMPCRMLEVDPKPKKAICTAPSFGRGISDLATINQALSTHVGRVAQKLRQQHSAASSLTVFIHTNRYKKSANGELAKQYYNSRSVELPHPTSSTVELVRYAHEVLTSIFAFGYEYQKVGVMLTGLVPEDHRQGHLFTSGPDERLAKLGLVVDHINNRHGRDRVRIASAGYDPSWHHNRQWMSPRYTTVWKDILTVN